MNKYLKIIKIVALFLITASVIFEIVVLGLQLTGGENAVAKLPVYAWQVTSDSMYPKIKNGNCIICAKLPFNWLKKGDIITYENNGDWITHQIVRVNDDNTVTTKGLANGYEDGKISEKEYVGKMLFKLPFARVFLDLTETVAGKIIFITVVVLLLFGSPIGLKIADKVKSKKKRNL